MRIDHIRYVVEVSKYKSINKASKNLYINQQQLSRMIAAVEEEFDIEIFQRTAKGVFLTEDGKEIIKKFEAVLEMLDSIGEMKEKSQNKTLQGKIHILSDVNIWSGYAGLYTSFMKEYPNINFFTENMSSKGIMDYLAHSEGIGQVSRIIREDEEEFTIPPELYYRIVSRGRIEVYGHHSNPLFCKYKTISLNTLLEYPLVNYKPFEGNEQTIMERIFNPIGNANIRYEVHNYRVFEEIVKETDCLFLAMRKPSYIANKDIIGIPLRDNVFLENGIVRNKRLPNSLYDAFDHFYMDYYKKLFETKV
ncbi:MAG: LysR family transcriptional regulator [Peptococcaceae bacterium]|nr:LysR family transcriptional regulator [Peptococcaceae bacterium]